MNKTPGRETEMLKLMKVLALVLFAVAIALPMWMPGSVECHQSVDVGAFSQTMEFRAGHITNGAFVDASGGQLIQARGTDSDIVEHITTAETVKAFRITTSTLGDGFVECISNTDLQNNVAAQPAAQRGTLTSVPVTEANNALRVGRFG